MLVLGNEQLRREGPFGGMLPPSQTTSVYTPSYDLNNHVELRGTITRLRAPRPNHAKCSMRHSQVLGQATAVLVTLAALVTANLDTVALLGLLHKG